jgi:hypothetical protein
VEWFSFLVNIKDIKDERIITLFWPIIETADIWYEIHFKQEYNKPLPENSFSNLKELKSRGHNYQEKIHIKPFDVLNPLKSP